MKITIGKTAGFCPGVGNAIQKAKEALKSEEKLYCLGEIVHNEQVIKSLEKNGMITIDEINDIPNNSKVMFRSHGEPKVKYDIANEKNLQVIDLTCGNVKSVHMKVEREKKNAFIIIVGKKNHAEIIGTQGFAGDNSYVIETEDDILDAYMEYEKTSLGKVYVVAQTTFSSIKFDELVKEIETNFIEADIIVDKTICNATETRQKETRELASKSDVMIIIGGKKSANTKELEKIAKEECENVYSIETVKEIESIEFSKFSNIGIMAGASTPKEIIEEVKEFVDNI